MIFIASIIFIIIGFLLFGFSRQLPTYFSYSEKEIRPLRNFSSNHEIITSDLKKWDAILFNLIKDHKLGDARASRVYTYLYTAQRDVAFLSKTIKSNVMPFL